MESQDVLEIIPSLRHGSQRKKTGLFFVEGVKFVSEALLSKAKVEAVLISPEILQEKCLCLDLSPLTAMSNVPVLKVGRRRYEKAARHFALKAGLTGIGALIHQSDVALEQLTIPKDGFAVALCSVKDAGNVGAILRTCDAVGCSIVFGLRETADPYGPEAVKASLGAIFDVTVVKCELLELKRWALGIGANLVGASPRASEGYRQVRYNRPTVLLLGNESFGLSEEELSACHKIVTVPMVGRRDSLNVAVAGAVILYELFYQGK